VEIISAYLSDDFDNLWGGINGLVRGDQAEGALLNVPFNHALYQYINEFFKLPARQ